MTYSDPISDDLRRRFAQRLLIDEGMNPRVVVNVGGWSSFSAIEPYLFESTGVGFQSPFVAAVVVAMMLAYSLANTVFEEVVFRGIFIRMASEGLQARSIGYAPAVVVGFLSSAPVFGFAHILTFIEGGR